MKDTTRLPYEIDTTIDDTLVTAHAGVPLLVELFRFSGAAEIAEERLPKKERRRGLTSSEMVESLLALWAAGGERCEDMEHLRKDEALEKMIGHGFPSPQTARDFLEGFHEEDLPLWHAGERSEIREESRGVAALGAINSRLVEHLQERTREKTATLDVDATIIESSKRAAKMTYEGERGYQPVVVVWAEQDVIVYDEFREGNVPAGVGNAHVVEKALERLPKGVEKVFLRADSALYEDATMKALEQRGVGYAISADMGVELRRAIEALPEEKWEKESEDEDAIRQWAEVVYVPDESGTKHKDTPCDRRYLAIRVMKRQGRLFADGTDRKHFAVVTNREGNGLELIQWHRKKAGTIERVHDVMKNGLAASGLPSQKFGANAAWFRMNAILYTLMSMLKRIGLSEELREARPKRLRFLLFNVVGRVIRHARETLCRVSSEAIRLIYTSARVRIRTWDAALSWV